MGCCESGTERRMEEDPLIVNSRHPPLSFNSEDNLQNLNNVISYFDLILN